MEFILLNLLNCCIENVIILTIFTALNHHSVRKHNYIVAFILIFGCSCVATFVDSFLFSILPFNYAMIFLSLWIAFRNLSIKDIFWNSLISYMLMIYLQVIFVCVYPVKLMGSHLGNILANVSTLLCSVILLVLFRHRNFKSFYTTNEATLRIFFLALCLPEFITVQFFVSLLSSTSKIVMLFLLFLQFLYVLLLLLIFLAITHRQERKQFQDTKQHIDVLNHILDNSKQSIHDFNKHIRYLQNTVTIHLENKQYDNLQIRINQYCNELLEQSEKEESILHLDDPVLRALLYGRQTQAKTSNIDFYIDATSSVLPNFPLKNYQIVEVLDNILDNAFECVETLSCKRWIRITLCCEKSVDNHFKNILCVQNPYEELDFSAVISNHNYSSKKKETTKESD